MMSNYKYIRTFEEIGKDDVGIVGGKGANLGELTSFGLDVPPGFCVTAQAYDLFVDYAGLTEAVQVGLEDLDVEDVDMLTAVSQDLRNIMTKGEIEPSLEEEIRQAYRDFSQRIGIENPEVAVRSSATAEDLPDASFAGQQDTR